MRLSLLVCFAILLAGCTSNSGTTTTTPTGSSTTPATGGTPGGGATPTSATTPAGGTVITLTPPTQQMPITVGNVSFDSLTLNVASLESAEMLVAIAHVTNHGGVTENPKFSFSIDNGTPQQGGALIGAGATANVTSSFNPAVGGDHVMHAVFGGAEKTATFHVRAPSFQNFVLAIDPTTPCQVVKFNGTFTNSGDGTANDTVLGVTITDNGQIVAKPSGSLAYVAAGTQPHVVAKDDAFHAACNAAPHAFMVDATLYWHNAQQGHVVQNVTL